ncbi:MAG: phage tail assembly chaperone [Lachnospiraceae bacterium]|nr:phage tail assembly chaperone [Lachnospiraceae bacterium]
MIGIQFQKPLTDYTAYSEAAAWANAHNAMIEDKGDYYEVISVPETTAKQQAAAIRAERDRRLTETDLIIIRCAEAGEPVPEEWKAYRQALRDIPEQPEFPDAVNWPEKPAAPANSD